MCDSDGLSVSMKQPVEVHDSRSLLLEEVNRTSITVTKSPENCPDVSYLNSFTGVPDSGLLDTLHTMSSALLLDDDGLSATMEAIEETNRFSCHLIEPDPVTYHSGLVDRLSLQPSQTDGEELVKNEEMRLTPTVPDSQAVDKFPVMTMTRKSPPTSGCLISSPVLAELSNADRTHSQNSSNPVLLDSVLDGTSFTNHESDKQEDTSGPTQKSSGAAVSAATILSTKSSVNPRENILHSNWRPVLRSVFERVLIERLWQCGELGGSKPRALLLSLWFFISRNFGVRSRSDHARLVLGNVQIRADPKTGSSYLILVYSRENDSRKSTSASRLATAKYSDIQLPARKDCVDRCPVHLFEMFCHRRPPSAQGLATPFYLQPDRTLSACLSDSSASAWFTPNALGKNRIGSMLNSALQNLGMPVRRQVNLVRFCDALAAAAITTKAGGQTGARLVQLLSDSDMDAISLDRELTCCAECVVSQACMKGTALHTVLANSCKESVQIPSAADIGSDSRSVRIVDSNSSTRFVPIRPTCAELSTITHATPCSLNAMMSQTEILSSEETVSSTFLSNPSVSGQSSMSSLLKGVLEQPGPEFGVSGDSVTLFTKTPTARNPEHKLQLQQHSGMLVGSVDLNPLCSSDNQIPSSTSNSTIVTQVRQNGVQLGNRKLSATLHAGSVPLELRELLDVVLAVARFVPLQTMEGTKDKAELSGFSSINSSPRVLRPPVGLVTQLLWRARALDDRGPWILTFTMWWLMQHYFGIGSRSHHVRLRWSHLRLVTGVLDPITSRSCDALEYAGPSEYTTVKAFALLESTGNGSNPVRRVYPSSGWAEPEIHVASILASDAPENRPRIRPLCTGPDVPVLMDREGPDFVSLYKAFSAHRSVSSCRPDSPFYVQPIHCKPVHWRHAVTAPWFGPDALGKNRIGSLMRNIVDKVVRVSLTCVAQAATAAAQQSCLDVIRRAVLAVPTSTRILAPSDVEADLIGRRQALADRLADVLGLSTNMVNESSWLGHLKDATTGINNQPLPVDSVIVQCEPQIKTRLLRLKSPTNVTTTAIMEDQQHFQPQSLPLLQVVTEPSDEILINHPSMGTDKQVQKTTTITATRTTAAAVATTTTTTTTTAATPGTKTSTQLVLLTANKLTGASTIPIQSVVVPSNSVINQTGLFLIPAESATGPVPLAVARQHSSVPSSTLILSNETLIQEVKTASAFITDPSSCSPFKLNALSNDVPTTNVPHPLTCVTNHTTNHGPVNLLVFTPNPVNTTSSTVTNTARLLSFHSPTVTHASNPVLIPVPGGKPTLFDLTPRTSLGYSLSHNLAAASSASLSSSSTTSLPSFVTSVTLAQAGQPTRSVTDLVLSVEDNRKTRSSSECSIKLPLEQDPHHSSQQCGMIVQPVEGINQSLLVTPSNQLLNSSVVTCNAPSILSIPNSVCVAIPGATMLQSSSLPVETYTLCAARTDSECRQVWQAEPATPTIKTTIYHKSISPEIRYVIPPPSASLIPGKPTPVSEPWPSGLELVADADTNSLLTSTGSTAMSTLSAAVVVTATETTANDATTTTTAVVGNTNGISISSITPESIQSVAPVSATIVCQQPSTSHYATGCTVWCGSSSQGPALSLLPLHQMTCHLMPPEPEPGQLMTIQDVINQVWATQFRDFPNYIDQLFRAGLLSTSTPWCLNFTIWFINSVAFEVENRAEHVSLRWGDFRLCRTADSRTEFLYFVNRATHRAYYLAASDSTLNVLDYGLTNDAIDKFGDSVSASKTRAPLRIPCPVAVFKAIRDHRPVTCLDPYSKLYLQPRIPDQSDRCKPHLGVTTRRDWFLERPWGKNRVGSLLTEATRLAGLPMISLRKYRARTNWPNSVEAPMSNSLTNGGESLPVELVSDSTATLDGENITTGSIEELNSGVSHFAIKRRKTSPICLDTGTLSTGRPSSLFSEGKSELATLLPSSSTILRPSSTLSCLPTSNH